MPGWAGSSWYWYRYMDAHNDKEFASKKAVEYWKDVDLYIGGSEHATGHLLYSRFWNKFMKDMGLVFEEEPFKKLINQGMIQGRSNFVYRLTVFNNDSQLHYFLSKKYADIYEDSHVAPWDSLDELGIDYKNSDGTTKTMMFTQMHVDVNIVNNDILNIEKFRKWRPDLEDAVLILDDASKSTLSSSTKGVYICGV